MIRQFDPLDHVTLRQQIVAQRQHAWDLEADIQWQQGIDRSRFFLPLDREAVAFPGASAEQSLVLSQLLGLIVNATVAEMETVAHKFRDVAWADVLRSYPVNPEMVELGDLFFAEEAKHAKIFGRYNQLFCQTTGIDPQTLKKILPQAYGSAFQKAILRNAKAGGHAFWWVVSVVEEESVLIYQQMYRHRRSIDPLFYEIHRRHFEEEARHANYAFLMLELIHRRVQGMGRRVHKLMDLFYSEVFSTSWILAELHRVMQVTKLKHEHEFFAVLASCVPLLRAMPPGELIRRLFVSAPYISSILNRRYHKHTMATARRHRAIGLLYPKPKVVDTFASPDTWAEDA